MSDFIKAMLGLFRPSSISASWSLPSGYDRSKEEEKVRARLVAKMRELLGVKYKLGAENDLSGQVAPTSTDCSEACELSYSSESYFKRPMPDGAKYQYEFCRKVNRPEPGDLGFMRYWSNGSQKTVWHVGMLTADGTVVHASASRGEVVEDRLSVFTSHHGFIGWGRHPEFIQEA